MHTHDTTGREGSLGDPECQEALDTLYHFLDGELTSNRRQLIQQHLDRCSSCLEVFDFEAELKIVVARRCKESVPDALRARIAAALAAASNTPHGSEGGVGNPTQHDYR
jgi:mycothiol system anti-sigma-R factor